MSDRIGQVGSVAWALDRRRFLRLAGGAGVGAMFGRPTFTAHGTMWPPGAPGLPTRAIVIGIDETANAPVLHNAKKDAVRFASWLESQGVPAGRIALLTNPPLAGPPVMGMSLAGATLADIETAVTDAIGQAGDRERLFFYFSGHGAAFARRTGVLGYGPLDIEDGIIPCNFRAPVSVKALRVFGLIEAFRASRFVEQFFFFDSCRNIAGLGSLHDVDVSEPEPGRSDPTQMILFATAPGRRTLDKTGMLTDQLLAALSEGKGMRLVYDPGAGAYDIRWDNLYDCIKRAFDPITNCVPIAHENDRDICLEPKDQVWPPRTVVTYPVLARLQSDAVATVPLTVMADPPGELSRLQLRIREAPDEGEPGPTRTIVPPELAAPIPLAPYRRYQLTFTASDGFSATPSERFVTLTAERTLAVTVVPPGQPPPGPAMGLAGTGTLSIQSSDRLAALELTDLNGFPIRAADGRYCAGVGSLDFPELRSGFYQAKVYLPNGRVVEQPVLVPKGERGQVDIVAQAAAVPSPFFAEVTKAVLPQVAALDPRGLDLDPDKVLAFGPEPAFIMSALSRAVDRIGPEDLIFHPESGLGVTPFPGDRTGLRILIGTDAAVSEETTATRGRVAVGLWRLDDPPGALRRPEPTKIDRLAVLTIEDEPGPFRLRLEQPEGPTDFALVLLPGHRGELVLEQDVEGRIRAYQAAWKLAAGMPQAEEMPFNPGDVGYATRLQRYLQSGQIHAASIMLGELLSRKRPIDNPILLAIAAALAAPDGGDRLTLVAQDLVKRYPELPDSQVARARSLEVEAGQRTEDAKRLYHAALDRGLPILSRFLEDLWHGARRYKIVHPRRELLDQVARRRIPGSLWTAWRPEGG